MFGVSDSVLMYRVISIKIIRYQLCYKGSRRGLTEWSVAMFLVMSCWDMFDLTTLESSISIILGYFSVAHWELMDIVIYNLMPFNCSLRNFVIIMIIFWCFPVACGELMWIFWIIFWFLLVACRGLRWFLYDYGFVIYEPRVGNLYVVLGSGLQWGMGP